MNLSELLNSITNIWVILSIRFPQHEVCNGSYKRTTPVILSCDVWYRFIDSFLFLWDEAQSWQHVSTLVRLVGSFWSGWRTIVQQLRQVLLSRRFLPPYHHQVNISGSLESRGVTVSSSFMCCSNWTVLSVDAAWNWHICTILSEIDLKM